MVITQTWLTTLINLTWHIIIMKMTVKLHRPDLGISVLEHAKGSNDYNKHKQDKLITRFQTYAPLRLDSGVSDVGSIYWSLFFK